MKHVPSSPSVLPSLTAPERHLLALLRLWQTGPEGQAAVWSDLCQHMGTARARLCLGAIEELLRVLRRHAWRMPTFLAPGTEAFHEEEASLARFVSLATAQDREAALSHAMLIVSSAGLLPLLRVGERVGLPLLCADCRARLRGVVR